MRFYLVKVQRKLVLLWDVGRNKSNFKTNMIGPNILDDNIFLFPSVFEENQLLKTARLLVKVLGASEEALAQVLAATSVVPESLHGTAAP